MAHTRIVPILLRGGRVTPEFRNALFSSANRAGMSVNEFVLSCAARQMRQAGVNIPGVFEPGDLALEVSNDNGHPFAPSAVTG